MRREYLSIASRQKLAAHSASLARKPSGESFGSARPAGSAEPPEPPQSAAGYFKLRRRDVLIAAASAVVLSFIPFAPQLSLAESAGDPSSKRTPMAGLKFFSPNEAAFVDAAVDRLIPSDALGPGAVAAGVTIFIDHQLAGPFGAAADWYMHGPWADGTDQQGYQQRRTPAQLYRAAIEAIENHTRRSSNQRFDALTHDEQDDLLQALDHDKLDLRDVSGKAFTTLLWQNAQEGFFADPVYLGNRNFVGWKLLGFPGPRYNYDDAIRRYGERYPLPTVGLMGRDSSRQPVTPL